MKQVFSRYVNKHDHESKLTLFLSKKNGIKFPETLSNPIVLLFSEFKSILKQFDLK